MRGNYNPATVPFFAAVGGAGTRLLFESRGRAAPVLMGVPVLVATYRRFPLSPVTYRLINAPAVVPGVDLSDHASYWREGFPAILITDTAFYRNDRYHTEQDTPGTLDYARTAKVVDGVRRDRRLLAECPDLKNELDCLLAGRPVRPAETKAFGCAIQRNCSLPPGPGWPEHCHVD